jgi:hypothetical protein
VVLRAVGGGFSVARYTFVEGLDLGAEPVPPETVRDRWLEIAGSSIP